MKLNFHPIENSADTARLYVPELIKMYNPKSVLDLGCNVGRWLHVFMQLGIDNVIGVDGDNMIPQLTIPATHFYAADLTQPISFNRRFDLVLCLEVAEHLDAKFADLIVSHCVNLSDTVFWSAASPGQGGYNHVNEQEPAYWIEKFKAHGYSYKMLHNILPPAPHDYYRKNAIEFKKIL